MQTLTALQDIDHTWGSDVALTPTGDFGRVSGLDRSKQRVLRRLMTPIKGYLFHRDYGGGLPERIGTILNLAEIRALIRTQMQLEASVSRASPIKVGVSQITNGVSVDLAYTALPDRQPVALSFDVSV